MSFVCQIDESPSTLVDLFANVFPLYFNNSKSLVVIVSESSLNMRVASRTDNDVDHGSEVHDAVSFH